MAEGAEEKESLEAGLADGDGLLLSQKDGEGFEAGEREIGSVRCVDPKSIMYL